EAAAPHGTKWPVMLCVRALLLVAILSCGGIASAAPGRPSGASSGNARSRDVSTQAATAVLFEFARPVPGPFWDALQGELDQTAAPDWPERSLVWMKRQEFQSSMEYRDMVQVQLKGHCTGESAGVREAGEGPLGWVYMIDREIQPVAYVNC